MGGHAKGSPERVRFLKINPSAPSLWPLVVSHGCVSRCLAGFQWGVMRCSLVPAGLPSMPPTPVLPACLPRAHPLNTRLPPMGSIPNLNP